MEKNEAKKIVKLQTFEKGYRAFSSKRREMDRNTIDNLRVDNPFILSEYVAYVEDSLKDTDQAAVYHWRTDEDDRENKIKVFFDFDCAKLCFKCKHPTDVSALEIYFLNKELRDNWENFCDCTCVSQDLLELFASVDMPISEEKSNYFEDILPREREFSFGDEFDCFMEDDQEIGNEENLFGDKEEALTI